MLNNRLLIVTILLLTTCVSCTSTKTLERIEKKVNEIDHNIRTFVM